MGEREIEYLRQVLKNNHPNQGELTKAFEKKIAERLGCEHAIAVTSGTVAIFLALKGLGIGPGDEVLVPDITFIATANAVDLCGAMPILVDVDPKTLNISIDAARAALTGNTKAIVPVHVSGRGADMNAVLALARERGLFVVEDAAEAFMSKRDGRFLGTFGVAGCFSFSAMKLITTGQGGMIVTNDEALAMRLRGLRNQGVPGRGTGGDDVHATIGYNFKFTDLQAAVGLGQLEQLEKRMARSRATQTIYREELSGIEGLALYPFDLAGGELPMWTDASVERRDELDAFLHEKNIDCRRYWFPVHTQAPYVQPDDRFPQSTGQSPKSIWFPSSFTSTDDDIRRVCREIKSFFQV